MMLQFSRLLLLLVLVSITSSAALAQDNLVGNWNVVAETPEGENESVWTFSESGGKISGQSVNENGAVSEFEAVEVDGDTVKFSIDIEFQGTSLLLGLEAKLSGDNLEGTWIASDSDGNQMAEGKLSGTRRIETEVLFDGTNMDNFRGYKKEEIGKGWKVDEGTLYFDGTKKSGDIITQKQYGSYELTFDWKISEGGNSGVMYRVTLGDSAPYKSGIEYQILDNDKHNDGKKRVTSAGSLYALYPPGDVKPKAPGEWNTSKIVIDGDKVQHWLNGEKVVDIEIDSEDWKKKVSESKFAKWKKFGKSKRGHIAFQDHGNPVWYRNIKIKAMD